MTNHIDPVKIAPKQFLKLTDLLVEAVVNPCNETDRALNNYQDAIGWPWRATRAQQTEWNDTWQRADQSVAR
jgi:hypothetical protein